MPNHLRALLIGTAFAIPPAAVSADEAKPPEQVSAESSIAWNARRIEHDGAILHVLIPASPATAAISLCVTLENRGRKEFECVESGYLLDCTLMLTDAIGQNVPYTNLGSNLFSENRPGGGQSACVQYTPGKTRSWLYDLSGAFERLKAGKYQLTLKATIYFCDPETKDCTKVVKLTAKDIELTVP